MISNPPKEKWIRMRFFFHLQNYPEVLNNNHCYQRWIKMIKVVTSFIWPRDSVPENCTKEIIWVWKESEAAQIGILGQETIESTG